MRYYLVFCWFLFLLCGCHDDYTSENELTGNKPIMLSGEIDQVAVTRVNDGGFCSGDIIGIYVVDYLGNTPGKLTATGNRANNMKYTFDEETNRWDSSHDIYWKDDKTHIDVYGYYPHGSPSNVEEYVFEIQKDQAREAADGMLGGYEASDFLWTKAVDVAPTSNRIRLPFRHRMSNAKVSLMEGTGFSEDEWAQLNKHILVLNTKHNSLINLNDGTIKPTGGVAETGIIPVKQGEDFRAIVVPQTIDASLPLFSITVGTESYRFAKEEAFTYISGKMHNFSIVVNKREQTGDYEFILANESITAWEDDLVSHDGTAREYVIIHVPVAGRLKESIAAADHDYRRLQNLKITGQIDARDFYFMRDEMDRLQSLNLKEVTIKEDNSFNFNNKDDEIPAEALIWKKTLLRIILPDKLNGIGRQAFQDCTNLTGSLIIPEGVTFVEQGAFSNCKNLNGILSLPTTLKKIEQSAFYSSGFTCELLLPSGLTDIGYGAFMDCRNLYGFLKLPAGLTSLGPYAFHNCNNLNGSFVIPSGITTIEEAAFCFYFNNASEGRSTLTLHDDIISIGTGSFRYGGFRGELVLPRRLVIIGDDAFQGNNFTGLLQLPPSLSSIGNNAFWGNSQLTGTLEIPDNVQSIGANSFADCSGLEKIIFPAGLENIQREAFLNCFGINSIVCKSSEPPYLQPGAFDGISKDNFTLEVPEQAVQQYRTAPGWSEFKRISAYRELVCSPAMVTVLNNKSTRDLILFAESEWEVENMPGWCTLSATNRTGKADLKLTIDAMNRGSSSRSGGIVFRLKDKNYTTRLAVSQYDYEYDEDQIITLQRATRGSGVNLLFLGDGFNAEDISKGDYVRIIHEQVNHFFSIEPYNTYRDYFNVYTAIAVSPESGIETVNTVRNTRFGTIFTGATGWSADYEAIFNYALRMPTVNAANLYQSLIVMVPNAVDYDGGCQMWEDGSAIAFCPVNTNGYPFDTRGIIQHEAGGHAFGKLGDENISQNAYITSSYEEEIKYYQSLGWFQNLSLTGKMHEVPWSHLIFHERYSSAVDIYEGGYMHSRGVFRSEYNSCMNNSIPYYSTVSREAIVKRIMEYAGETYTFEKFIANDKLDSGAANTRSAGQYQRANPYGRQSAPQIHKGKPGILK